MELLKAFYLHVCLILRGVYSTLCLCSCGRDGIDLRYFTGLSLGVVLA
jgi:hypothetical protein